MRVKTFVGPAKNEFYRLTSCKNGAILPPSGKGAGELQRSRRLSCFTGGTVLKREQSARPDLMLREESQWICQYGFW